MSSKEDYINGDIFRVKCIDCGFEYETNSTNFQDVNFCPACNSSNFQKEVLDFIVSLGFKAKSNDRKEISPLELDIFIPDCKLAIECDGIYWHSSISGQKDKNYHLKKTELCNDKGIRLVHIFENEWSNKKEIVKHILSTILNKIDKIVYARKCSIKEISYEDCKKFLDQNHLQGSCSGFLYLGLFYKNELISCSVFGKSRFRNDEIELIRFSNKLNHKILYALPRFLKYMFNNYSFKRVITFCDRRYFNADGYRSVGFKDIRKTGPNYFYFKRGKPLNLLNRLQFQKFKLKDKLQTFDENLSEWENMKLNGFDRIWDCGNIKLEYLN